MRCPSPDAAAFYTSGRTSNEAAFLYQLFARQFGTNNLPDCSNMCHESSGAALNETIGIGKGCVTLEDFEKRDAIFIIGQNPGTNHPRMLTSLQQAKESRDGHRREDRLDQSAARVGQLPLQESAGSEDTRCAFPKMLLGQRHGVRAISGCRCASMATWPCCKGIMKEMLAEEEARPGTVFDQRVHPRIHGRLRGLHRSICARARLGRNPR